jgi:hypothetical protein
MVDMVAAKRVKYPHGPDGREYAPGEAFQALSERDAKGLFIAGKATYGTAAKPSAVDLPVMQRATKVEPLAEVEDPAPLSYRTRHMTAAGPTGGVKQPSSSHQAPAPKARASKKRKGAAKS